MLNILYKTGYYALMLALIAIGSLLVLVRTEIISGYEVKIVESGSMEPAIITGALVMIAERATYNVGDVITFGADTPREVPTTHRIVSVSGEGRSAVYSTKGDANEEKDGETVPHSSVIGKVFVDVPYLGFIIDFARQPIGFAMLFGVPALLVILQEFINIYGEMRNRRRGPTDPTTGTPVVASNEPTPERLVEMPRRRVVEEIRPRRVEVLTMEYVPTPAVAVPRHQSRRAAAPLATLAVLTAIFSSATIGGTFSYFNDLEESIGNFFGATSLVGTLEGLTLQGEVCIDTPPVVGSQQLDNAGGLPFDYELTVELATSSEQTGLCDNLNIVAKKDGTTEYDGPLSGLSLFAISLPAGDVDTWTFEATVATGTPANDIVGQCVFDTVFHAKQEQFGFGEAFNDEERTTNTITAADTTQCEPPDEEQVCHFLPNTICLDIRKVIREKFVPNDFQFHIVGTSTGINAILNHEDSIDLPVGHYDIKELFPPTFHDEDWKTKWDGHCDDSDVYDMLGYVDVDENDLDEVYWHCSVSNIWDGDYWIDPHDGREEERHDREEIEYNRPDYDDAIRDREDQEERGHATTTSHGDYGGAYSRTSSRRTTSYEEGETVEQITEVKETTPAPEPTPEPTPTPEPGPTPEPEPTPAPTE